MSDWNREQGLGERVQRSWENETAAIRDQLRAAEARAEAEKRRADTAENYRAAWEGLLAIERAKVERLRAVGIKAAAYLVRAAYFYGLSPADVEVLKLQAIEIRNLADGSVHDTSSRGQE